VIGFAGDFGGEVGGAFPAGGGGGVLPAGGGGGVFVAGLAGGGATLAAGGGGVFPAGVGALVAAGGGVFPAAGGVLPAVAGVFPAAVFAPGLVSVPFAGDFAPLSPGFAAEVAGEAICPEARVGSILTFLGFPKSSSVVSGRISVTIPAAMVFPPSLSANLDPFVMVMGKLSLALTVRLSPGLAILTPSGRQISAAVSAVLK
jgi:hypothetical protein